MKKSVIYGLSMVLLLVLWVVLTLIVNHPLLLPGPWVVFLKLIDLLTHFKSLEILLLTLLRLVISIVISSFIAISLGLLAGFYPKFNTFMKPYVTTLRTIPVLSIIVIMLILLGFIWTPYVITFFMVFPIIFQATVSGLKSIDPSLIDVIKLENRHPYLKISAFYLPMIMSYLKLSFLQSFGLGLKVLVMAEYLAQTKKSIGYSIYLAKTSLNYDEIFAWTILLIIMSLIIELMIQKASIKKISLIKPKSKESQ